MAKTKKRVRKAKTKKRVRKVSKPVDKIVFHPAVTAQSILQNVLDSQHQCSARLDALEGRAKASEMLDAPLNKVEAQLTRFGRRILDLEGKVHPYSSVLRKLERNETLWHERFCELWEADRTTIKRFEKFLNQFEAITTKTKRSKK